MTSDPNLDPFRDSIVSVLSNRCTSSAIHAHFDGNHELGKALWNEASALGWLAIGVSEQHGGFDLGVSGLQLLATELGRVAAPGPFIATLAAAQVLATLDAGQPGREWLARLVSGEATAAILADVAGPSGLQVGENGLTGATVLLGSTDADVALIPLDDGRLLLMSLKGADVRRADYWDRTRDVTDIEFVGNIPIAVIEDGGVARTLLTRNFAFLVAADSIGLGHGIIARTIAYMQERMQFGRPIGSFQALKHRIVDLVARVKLAEHMLHQAAAMFSADDACADLWVALAKAGATDAAVLAAGDCVQLHGGVGFTWEYDPHIYLKRARLNEMLVADNRVMRDRAAEYLASAARNGLPILELSLDDY